ncbi:hypothetical protein BDV18DRAFT_163837 [Aspergillus unguis]
MGTSLPLEGHSLAIFATAAVMLVLAIIAVAMRSFVRIYLVRAFGWDDGLMVIALALFIALCILCMLGSAEGIGHHLLEFTSLQQLQRALLVWWLGQMLYLWASAVAKVAIALALLRLAVRPVHRIILWAVCVVVVVSGLVFWLVLLFDCWPVEYFWERLNILKRGQCLSTHVLLIIAYVYSSLTIACDFTLGIMPVCLIWRLQMNARTKLALVGILSLGAIASVGVVVRLPYLHNYSDPDFLHSTYQIAVWSLVETGLAIMAGSLITLRPMFRWFLDGSCSYTRQSPHPSSRSRKYARSSLTANASEPASNDPKFWRPDIEHSNTVITAVSAPRGRDLEEDAYPLSPIASGHKSSVSVQQTFRLSQGGFASFNKTQPLEPPSPAYTEYNNSSSSSRGGYGAGYNGFRYEF